MFIKLYSKAFGSAWETVFYMNLTQALTLGWEGITGYNYVLFQMGYAMSQKFYNGRLNFPASRHSGY